MKPGPERRPPTAQHQGPWPTSARGSTREAPDSPGGLGLTCGTLAQELVDLVQAAAILEAGAAGTLVLVHLTMHTLVAWGWGRGRGASSGHGRSWRPSPQPRWAGAGHRKRCPAQPPTGHCPAPSTPHSCGPRTSQGQPTHPRWPRAPSESPDVSGGCGLVGMEAGGRAQGGSGLPRFPYQACRYTGTPRSGPGRWRRSDTGWRRTR